MHKSTAFLIPLFALAFLLIGCGGDTGTNESVGSETAGDAAQKDTSTMEEGLIGFDGTLLEGKHEVIFHTSEGDITLKLDADAAPKTVTNFVVLAQMGYYDGLTFHRVIDEFMVQGGDPNGNGTGGESIFGPTFEDEINAKSYNLHKMKLSDAVDAAPLPPELKDATVMDYLTLQGYAFDDSLKSLPMSRGAIAMANRGPNTNGSQFFIVQREGGTDWLEGKHTVFGKVTDGLDIVDAISAAPKGVNDVPVEPITYTVEVVE